MSIPVLYVLIVAIVLVLGTALAVYFSYDIINNLFKKDKKGTDATSSDNGGTSSPGSPPGNSVSSNSDGTGSQSTPTG